MTQFAIETPPVLALRIAGQDTMIPIRQIDWIGRNNAAHAFEIGRDGGSEDQYCSRGILRAT